MGLPSVAGAQAVPEFDGEACTIVGAEADDVLYGTSGRDIICGLGGNDTIWAGAGDDAIDGGSGNDRIGAGPGSDVVHAGDGADVVWGNTGMNVIQGGLGPDRLWGGDGIDFLAADEFVDQAPEDREMTARTDRDADTNILGGGAGLQDYLYGAAGDDRLYAGEDDGFEPWDGVDGGAGHLFGFGGDDILVGRAGSRPLIFDGGVGDDRIYSNGGALAVLPQLAQENGDDVIYGSPYRHVLIDPYGQNRIVGGAGNDWIVTGGPDSDAMNTVYGGDGDDTISIDGVGSVAYGGAGDDEITGGWRSDRLIGGPGNDVLIGDRGDDVLIGSAGADRLYGAGGSDILWAGNDSDVDELYGNGDQGNGVDQCFGGPGDIINCVAI
jgi:Ca2+-binding RTX toxin-like protein